MALRYTETRNNYYDGHVFMFPARAPEIEGRRLAYLFSVRQVAEVLNQPAAQPVPFAPSYTEGITQWRGRVLPVLSLEHCLGISISEKKMPLRSIVIRSVTIDAADNLQEVYTVFKVGTAIRQLELPLSCAPTRIPNWISDPSMLSGVYASDGALYFVVNIENILGPKGPMERHVS
jgi:chemotaxis signal transduction protein